MVIQAVSPRAAGQTRLSVGRLFASVDKHTVGLHSKLLLPHHHVFRVYLLQGGNIGAFRGVEKCRIIHELHLVGIPCFVPTRRTLFAENPKVKSGRDSAVARGDHGLPQHLNTRKNP